MATEGRDFTAAAFYAYLREGRFMGVRCRECGWLAAAARPMCPVCHGGAMEWHQFSGRGWLRAFTCISVVPAALAAQGYGRDNPYCSGIVELAEGPRVSARILGVDAAHPQTIPPGMAVTLNLAASDAGERPSLVFEPAVG